MKTTVEYPRDQTRLPKPGECWCYRTSTVAQYMRIKDADGAKVYPGHQHSDIFFSVDLCTGGIVFTYTRNWESVILKPKNDSAIFVPV